MAISITKHKGNLQSKLPFINQKKKKNQQEQLQPTTIKMKYLVAILVALVATTSTQAATVPAHITLPKGYEYDYINFQPITGTDILLRLLYSPQAFPGHVSEILNPWKAKLTKLITRYTFAPAKTTRGYVATKPNNSTLASSCNPHCKSSIAKKPARP